MPPIKQADSFFGYHRLADGSIKSLSNGKGDGQMEQQLLKIAFSEGYAACRAGKSNIDNPYSGRGEDGLEESWNEGWFERCDDEAETFDEEA